MLRNIHDWDTRNLQRGATESGLRCRQSLLDSTVTVTLLLNALEFTLLYWPTWMDRNIVNLLQGSYEIVMVFCDLSHDVLRRQWTQRMVHGQTTTSICVESVRVAVFTKTIRCILRQLWEHNHTNKLPVRTLIICHCVAVGLQLLS